MTRRALWSTVATAAVMILATGFAATNAPAASVELVPFVAPPEEVDLEALGMDCWDCRCCSTCDLIKVPDWGPPGGDYFVHDCNWACGSAGTCGEEDLDPEDFAFAWEVVRRGDVDEVLKVLKSFPDNIAVNVERGAVQFWSCGKISASLDFDGDISAIIE